MLADDLPRPSTTPCVAGRPVWREDPRCRCVPDPCRGRDDPALLAGCGGSSASTTLPDPGSTASTSSPPQPSSSGDAMAGMPGMGEASASPSATLAGTVVHVDLVAGRPKVRPTAILEVRSGDTISIVATADKNFSGTKPHEIHLHGFNYLLKLPPGQTITKTFANQPKGPTRWRWRTPRCSCSASRSRSRPACHPRGCAAPRPRGQLPAGSAAAVLTTTSIATIQVISIVTGHVLGVFAAHDRSVRLFPRASPGGPVADHAADGRQHDRGLSLLFQG